MNHQDISFSLPDYLVLATVLLISSLIGLYYRLVSSRKNKKKCSSLFIKYSIFYLCFEIFVFKLPVQA